MAQTSKKSTEADVKKMQAARPSASAKKKESNIERGFRAFVMRSENLRELGIFFIGYLIQYAIVSSYYPDPLCLQDSTGYVVSSVNMLPNLFRPLGYSWFLKFLYGFSHTIDFVLMVQYWFSALTVLLLLCTVKYFYPPSRPIWFKILAACLILSPTVWYLDRWLLSDGLFFTLTLIWLVSLLWITERRSIPAIAVHILTLYAIIYVRHIGLIYPVLSCVIFLYRFRLQAWYLCALSIAVLLFVVSQSKHANKKAFGVDTYSGFSSWNQANNAISVLPYVKVDTTQLPSEEVRLAHRIISKLPDSLFSTPNILSSAMIWSPQNSLQDVQKALAPRYSNLTSQQLWLKTADVLGEYSSFLIKHYPGAYFRHFVLQNAGVVFNFTEEFKFRAPVVFNINQGIYYQRYRIEKETFNNESDIYDSIFNPISNFVITFWMLMCLLAAVIAYRAGALKQAFQQSRYPIIALLVFLTVYLGFSVTASVIGYRYMYVVPFLLVVLCYMLVRSIGAGQRKVAKPAGTAS